MGTRSGEFADPTHHNNRWNRRQDDIDKTRVA